MPTRPPTMCLDCRQPTSPGPRCPPCTKRRTQRYEADRRRREGSSTQRGYGAEWRRLRSKVLREQPFCQACGSSDRLHVDHIIPLKRGGTSTPVNVRVLCRSCHSKKTLADRRHEGRGPERGRDPYA